ncbi:hypothetical protein MMC30_002468 [Trapelia coarctata]|nr:hypothetical protein [Trapelia coarctata]
MSSSDVPPSPLGPAVPHNPWESPSDSGPSSNDSSPVPSPAQAPSFPAPPTSLAAQTPSVPAQTTSVTPETTLSIAETTSILTETISVQTTTLPVQTTFVPAPPTSLAAETASLLAQATSAPAQTISITAQNTSLPAHLISGPSRNPFQQPAAFREFQYTSCTECQQRDPNYIGCSHPEDPDPQTPRTIFILPQYQQQTTAPAPARGPMLRVSALKALFKENLNEDAKAIFLTTTHGTLLASAPASLPSRTFRNASALGGLTWRVATSILAGQPAANFSSAKPLKTLAQKTTGDGETLATLVLQFEERVLVLCWMKENLLVGVLGDAGVGEVKGEGKVGEDGGDGEGEGDGETGGGEEEGEGGSAADGGNGWEGAEKHAEAMAAFLRVEMRGFSIPSSIP